MYVIDRRIIITIPNTENVYNFRVNDDGFIEKWNLAFIFKHLLFNIYCECSSKTKMVGVAFWRYLLLTLLSIAIVFSLSNVTYLQHHLIASEWTYFSRSSPDGNKQTQFNKYIYKQDTSVFTTASVVVSLESRCAALLVFIMRMRDFVLFFADRLSNGWALSIQI